MDDDPMTIEEIKVQEEYSRQVNIWTAVAIVGVVVVTKLFTWYHSA
jgi:hypothetical protein